jgi:hypothetical protein
MLPSTIKTAPIEIVKTNASQHGGQAAGEVLHRSQSLPPGNEFEPKSKFEQDPGECSTASAGVLFSAAERYRQTNGLEIFLKCVWLAVAAIHERSVTSRL